MGKDEMKFAEALLLYVVSIFGSYHAIESAFPGKADHWTKNANEYFQMWRQGCYVVPRGDKIGPTEYACPEGSVK